MNIDECINRINRYFRADTCDCMPRIVNVDDRREMREIVKKICVGSTQQLSPASLCGDDELPALHAVYNMMQEQRWNAVLVDISTILKLHGARELEGAISTVLGMKCKGRIVVILYKCGHALLPHKHDPKRGHQVWLVEDVDSEGEPTTSNIDPAIILAANGASCPNDGDELSGIHALSAYYEREKSNDKQRVYVHTHFDRASLPNSILHLKDMGGAFEMVASKCSIPIDKSWGTDEQWRYAHERIADKDSFEAAIASEFDLKTLDNYIGAYRSFPKGKKWLYFMALKMYGVKDNDLLVTAARDAATIDDLPRAVWRSALYELIDIDSNDYWDRYEARKKLLYDIGPDSGEAKDFISIAGSRGAEALYLMTDLTPFEKEEMLRLLDRYGDVYDKDELIAALRHLWPDLANYLSRMDLKNDMLNDYFEQYRYLKVINRVTPQFLSLVDQQAETREYNKILSPRTSKTEAIDKKDARLVFFDALGVEFVAYIQAKCEQSGMFVRVTPCLAELPTITHYNKDFIDVIAQSGITMTDIRNIDDAKHHDDKGYDYTKTKLPVHLIKELEIIDKALMDIKDRLKSGKYKKAVIISDHGASRLAVIANDDLDTVIDGESKGRAGGRFCEYVDDAEKTIPHATVSTTPDGKKWLILASYSRFKGSRRPSVETHGGATLEELVVPIIEITLKTEDYQIEVKTKEITVYFKQKASIAFYSDRMLRDVSIELEDGTRFTAEPSEDGQNFIVNMPSVKNAGTYTFDVYSEGNRIKTGLEFSIKKAAGSIKRDLI